MKRIFATGLTALLLASPALAGTPLKCTGSTTITNVIFTPEIKAEIAAKVGVDIEAIGSSSGAGFKDLLDGKVTCSMSTNTLEGLMAKAGLAANPGVKVHPLGGDQVIPIVHRNNSVKTKSLTKEQWAGVYSGKIKNWSEVGGPDMPIIVVISADEGSATRIEVQKDIMAGAAYPDNVRKATTTKDEVLAVAATMGAVGAVGKGLAVGNAGVAIMPDVLLKRNMILLSKEPAPAGLDAVVKYVTDNKARIGIE
ncbi:MAG: substrate-binding domain-containing protein [Rhodospirillaceae bacterium]|nr:substrate-binding domain-containing protein [Rhodospirillales bacterium]